jgi:hypothetical protein
MATATVPRVLLLEDLDVLAALKIDMSDLDWLVSTRQLLPISIRGKRRFLLREIEKLVQLYHKVQHRNQ